MNLALLVEYDGSAFAGSQAQPGKRTVLGLLQAAIDRLEPGRPHRLVAAGRTDAGVHAKGQVIGFTSDRWWPAREWSRRLDGVLPADVTVRGGWEPGDRFDARRMASWRYYRYQLTSGSRPVLERHDTAWLPGEVQAGAVRAVLASLVGRHDFRGFTPVGPALTVRTVLALEAVQQGDVWSVEVRGESFLHRQVRYMVAAAFAVGQGRVTRAGVAGMLEAGVRPAGLKAAPAAGLTLMAVGYPPGVGPKEGDG